MQEFLLLLRGGEENPEDFSPQELQEHINKYFAWIETLTEAGHFKGGVPLAAASKVLAKKDKITVRDGPFAESKEVIGGIFFIQATDLAEAVEIARGCPALEVGSTVEVRPVNVDLAEGLKQKISS